MALQCDLERSCELIFGVMGYEMASSQQKRQEKRVQGGSCEAGSMISCSSNNKEVCGGGGYTEQ